MSWSEFLRAHWGAIAACDFFTTEAPRWKRSGATLGAMRLAFARFSAGWRSFGAAEAAMPDRCRRLRRNQIASGGLQVSDILLDLADTSRIDGFELLGYWDGGRGAAPLLVHFIAEPSIRPGRASFSIIACGFLYALSGRFRRRDLAG